MVVFFFFFLVFGSDRLYLRRLWLRVPCRKVPVFRHLPIELEQKVALCGANKIDGLFALYSTVPKTNLFDFQPKPPKGIRSRCKIADEFEDDLMDDSP